MEDVMIDLETLAVSPESVILTIGAVKFNPFTDEIARDKGLYLRIEVDEQLELGREVNEDTVLWWGNQAEVVREEALGDHDRVPLETLVSELNKFVVNAKNIWAQGPVFDIVILENLYKQLQQPVPWHYWQVRDSRTVFGMHGDPRQKNRDSLHNALADCISQAEALQTIYQKCYQKGLTFKN